MEIHHTVQTSGVSAAPSYELVAEKLKVSSDGVKILIHRLRKHYSEKLREAVEQTVTDPLTYSFYSVPTYSKSGGPDQAVRAPSQLTGYLEWPDCFQKERWLLSNENYYCQVYRAGRS